MTITAEQIQNLRQQAENYSGEKREEMMNIATLMESDQELKKLRVDGINLPKESQLKNFKATHYFTTAEVVNFCKNDENSPFKGKDINQEAVTSWLRSGKLKGFRNISFWYVTKAALLEYFEYRTALGR